MTLLLLATLAELVLLGSGRLLQVGPLTVRMLLYMLCVGVAVLYVLAHRRLNTEVTVLTLVFLAITGSDALIGLTGGAPLSQVTEDVKPQLFFLSLLFFQIAIVSRVQVARISTLIRGSSLLLAVGFLAVVALLYLAIIPFGSLYAYMSQSDDFFFRGDVSFFYKGFLYLGIGVFFFAFERGVRPKIVAALLMGAVAATLTRGLMLSVAVVLALGMLLRNKSAIRALVGAGLVGMGTVGAWVAYTSLSVSRADSDALRAANVASALVDTTPLSFLVGHGLGTSIGGRARIEESYISIFYQQGAIGLGFWFVVFLLLARAYHSAVLNGERAAAEPYFLGGLFVFVESATNPFLTNPIGMAMVLTALVACRVLANAAPVGNAAA